jgi:hypothetical protein
MSLTIIKPLPQVLLTKNPATLTFLKRGIYASEGAYADVKFELNWSSLGIGAIWKLQWGSNIITLTFAAAETASPFTVLEYASGTVPNYLYEYLVPSLNKIEALINDFIIEPIAYQGSSNFYIRFRARKKGTAYNIATATGTTITVTSTISQSGSNAVVLNNYKVKLRVLVEEQADTGVLKMVKELEGKGYPDEVNNEMQIAFRDLPALLSRYSFSKLPFDPYKVYLWEDLFSKFNIEYAEVYGENPETYKVEKLSPFNFTAFTAGVDIPHADYYEWLESFGTTSPLKFLTFQPEKKLVSKAQPEWLLMNANTSAGAFAFIRVELQFNESPNTNFTIAWNAAWNDKLVLIPVGFEQLGLSAYETATKQVLSYTVFVYGSGGILNRLTEFRHYIVDQRAHREEKFLLFFNSLTGIDTVRLKGTAAKQLQSSQEVVESVLDDSTTTAQGTMNMINKSYQNAFGANTGFLRKSEIDYYTELLKAEQVFECGVIPPKIEGLSVFQMEFKKLIITSNKYQQHETNQFLWSYDIDFKYAWEDINYTEGDVPGKLDFDEYVEITIENTSATTDYNLTVWMQNAYNSRYYVNSELQLYTSNNQAIPMYPGTTNRIIIKAKNLVNLVLTAQNTALRITYNQVPISRLNRMDTVGFSNVKHDYFVNRLRYAKNLTRFFTGASFDARNTDMLLKELVGCAQNFGNLNHATVEGTAPSAAGLIDKAELISLGVTTTTS